MRREVTEEKHPEHVGGGGAEQDNLSRRVMRRVTSVMNKQDTCGQRVCPLGSGRSPDRLAPLSTADAWGYDDREIASVVPVVIPLPLCDSEAWGLQALVDFTTYRHDGHGITLSSCRRLHVIRGTTRVGAKVQ